MTNLNINLVPVLGGASWENGSNAFPCERSSQRPGYGATPATNAFLRTAWRRELVPEILRERKTVINLSPRVFTVSFRRRLCCVTRLIGPNGAELTPPNVFAPAFSPLPSILPWIVAIPATTLLVPAKFW